MHAPGTFMSQRTQPSLRQQDALKNPHAAHPSRRTAAVPVAQQRLHAALSGRGGEDCKAQQSVPRSALLRTTAATLPQLVLVGSQHPARAAIIEEDAAERLFEAVGGSVVSIWVRMDGGGEGLGSGVIWDRKGSIVTNYHVVQKVVPDRSATQALTVTVGRDSYPAMLLGTDADHDIAVLRIDAPANVLQPISVGQSTGLKVGQSVFAIGSPLGYGKSLSTGVISREGAIPSPVGSIIRGAIQTDAAISSGNSGGPLLDSSGRLVGVNTTPFTRLGTGRGNGVNFAVPIDLVMSIVPNLILSGTNRRAQE